VPIREVGKACPYKEKVCDFDGDCYDCPTFKALELKTFQRGDLD